MNYIVQSGDTLYGIASRFGTTVDAIMRANRLQSPFIYVGQQLFIPTGQMPGPGPGQGHFPPPTPAPMPPTGPGVPANVERRIERLENQMNRLERQVNRLTNRVQRIERQLNIREEEVVEEES